MKKINTLYWIFTILFCFMMLGSAIPDILLHPMAVKGMHEDLGYPIYFIPFIGVAKALGVAALLIPGYPRIREWAYAGLFFDLIGAGFSIIAAGMPPSAWLPMALPIALGIGSYYFERRRSTANSELHVANNYPLTNELKVVAD